MYILYLTYILFIHNIYILVEGIDNLKIINVFLVIYILSQLL